MNPTKLHPSLASALSTKAAAEAPLHVIVRFLAGPVARGEAVALAAIEPDASFRLLHARALTVSAETVAALSMDPGVDLIWPDLPVHAWLDTRAPLVRAPRVWDLGFTGRGVRIGIVDTGIDAGHPDFGDRLRAYRDFVTSEPAAQGEPRDPNGHGTHVAGVAAGSGSASDGRYRGIAPEAELVVARVLDGAGNGRTSHVMAGIEWAMEQGARVINVSLGGPPYPSDGSDAFSVLCDAAVDAGAVVCVAAGNLGPTGHTIGAPAAAAKVITVGASRSLGDDGREGVAPFSSRGPTGDGRAKPDLLFPGEAITAARATGTSLGTVRAALYTSLSGTSQATPMAAGSAALLLQATPGLQPDEIKSRLRRGARRLPDAAAVAQGAGRGDAYNTFVAAEGRPAGDTPPAEEPPRTERAGCLAAPVAALRRR